MDVVVAAVLAFGLFKVANSAKAIKFLGVVLGGVTLLVASSYVALPGVHLLAQVLLIILLISFPIVFHQEWQNLFERTDAVAPAPVSIVTKVIVSFVIAVAAVAVTTGSATQVGQLPQEIPIKAVNVPDGMAAHLSGTQKVKVVISAPRHDWRALTSDSFSATVDIAKQGEGTYDLPLSVTSKVINVRVLRVNPDRAFVSVEPVIKKTVPVAVRFSGKAGNDLVPDLPKITPDKVEVAGPKSVIADLTQAIVPIALSGEAQAITTKGTLRAEASNGDEILGVTFMPAEVDLSIALIKAGKVKTVGIRPVISGQPASGYWVKSVSASPAVVAVIGNPEQLNALTDIPTTAYSITGITADTQQDVTLSFPSGITAADNTIKVQIKVILAKTETTKLINPELIYVGLSEGLKIASINPTSVAVIISGPSDLIGNVVLKVALDLAPYKSAGVYSVKIKNTDITLPEGVTLVSFLPSAIDVTLENR